MPDIVYAQASPRSLGGVSLFDVTRPISHANVVEFASDEAVIRVAAARLSAAGFQVLQIAPTTINIAAPPGLYEEYFDTTLVTEERPVVKPGGVEDTATFIDCADTAVPGLISTAGCPVAEVVEGVAIEEPVYFHESALAPTKAYWHLRVPGDVSLGVNADKVHRGQITGLGVKAVMVDSGWYRHPYFVQRGYRAGPVVLGPATTNPNDDESGHGTGESANLFAAAPDADFTMVKVNFVNSVGAFNAAIALSPHIISCSWGRSVPGATLSAADQAQSAAVASAVAAGIVVVFSAGNGGAGFPGQHPDVISAGGVMMEPDGSLHASDYTSGFPSLAFPGRNVPDLSGLVGMRPGASYIMLPVQPGDDLDESGAGGTHPPKDETDPDDGWAAFSGTSAAAPQIAGVCALITQACGRLTPAQVKEILNQTARDVTTGTNAMGRAAGPGYDLATGWGLVDAHKAVMLAKVRCNPIERGPIERTPIGPAATPEMLRAPGVAGLSAADAAALEELILEGGEEFDL